MLRKGMKSLQLSLNELLPKLGSITVSNMAYSKARRKFKHTAFIELNQIAVVETMYEDGDYETYKGFRVSAIDGSRVMLPTNDETIETFGTIGFNNGQNTQSSEGIHSYALASVRYDVLNRIALDAQLLPCRTWEVTAACTQLDNLTKDDLVIYDRGYQHYQVMAATVQAGGHFLIRCKRNSGIRIVDDMLKGNGIADRVVTIHRPTSKVTALSSAPAYLRVRFVRIQLDTGEYEVLATSVLDNKLLTIEDLKALYWLRWGVETFYGILKTRLTLENFSGLSAEAIRQDFFATIFLCGIESIFIADAEDHLRKQRGGHPKKVNKAVSFNVIKNHAFELFYSKEPKDKVLEKLTDLFLTSPTLVRKNRKPPRSTASAQQRLSFWKRKRKAVF